MAPINNNPDAPFFHLSIVKSNKCIIFFSLRNLIFQVEEILYIEYFSVLVQEVAIALDEELVVKFIQFMQHVLKHKRVKRLCPWALLVFNKVEIMRTIIVQ